MVMRSTPKQNIGREVENNKNSVLSEDLRYSTSCIAHISEEIECVKKMIEELE